LEEDTCHERRSIGNESAGFLPGWGYGLDGCRLDGAWDEIGS